MKSAVLLALVGAAFTASPTPTMMPTLDPNSPLASFLGRYNKSAVTAFNTDTIAQWTFATNTTKYNLHAASQADSVLAAFSQKWAGEVKQYYTNIPSYATPNAKRQLKMIGTVGISLNSTDTVKLSNYIGAMVTVYNNATICSYANGKQNCNKRWVLDPDMFNFLANSTDYNTLTYIWQQWRQQLAVNNVTYAKFVALSNRGARQGNFSDTGAFWRSWYESATFQQQIQNLYYQILPLYEHLHAYVRRQLMTKYSGKYPSQSTIPAQLLGNMWAQEWENIYGWTQPYPGKAKLDVTAAMVAQGYNPVKMFHVADNFFQSIGFKPMIKSFWTKSVIVKPVRKPTNFVCHASAWDFYTAHDFRIKMCTSVTMDNLITIHHEMGHIQYYMHYATQPVVFRNGANPGFHEAIGDTIAKSVSTPNHLKKIGLLTNYQQSNQQDINYLYKQALEKVAFLPWGYLMDKWRWQVFSGSVPQANWNKAWWKLRYQLQGLSAPGDTLGQPGSGRPAGAFDPAAKSHIDDNTPYIRYFVSFIVQFQFYQRMCTAAGVNTTVTPLYQCDFANSTKAGNVLGNMLNLGSSVPWQVAMTQLTGQPNMNAGPLLSYFSLLQTYLNQTNVKNCECYGWGPNADANYPSSVLAGLPQPRCKMAYSGGCPPPPNTGAAAGLTLAPIALLLAPLLALLLKLA